MYIKNIGVKYNKESIESKTPPLPIIILPESFTLTDLLITDSTKSPIGIKKPLITGSKK